MTRNDARSSVQIRKLTYSALYLAIALVLPFLTGQIPEIGSMLCPMHIPALLCGFVCGWPWGLAVGFVSPLLRSLLFGMPTAYTAAAMAAGALVSLRGGTNEQIGHAVAMALKNLMGLVCDPVAGLVEVPCVKRNVIGAVNAISAADMALAGIESRIPVDEVIDAMGEVGRRMPVEFRETALGGLAATPTGKAVKERMPHGAQ